MCWREGDVLAIVIDIYLLVRVGMPGVLIIQSDIVRDIDEEFLVRLAATSEIQQSPGKGRRKAFDVLIDMPVGQVNWIEEDSQEMWAEQQVFL